MLKHLQKMPLKQKSSPMFPAADTLIPVARVLKSYGTNGEVMISFPADMSEYLSKNDEPVFLFYDGLPVPFFIESFTARGPRKAVVSLTGIRTLEAAEETVGQDMFLDPAIHPELREEDVLLPGGEEYDITLDDLIGFTVLNSTATIPVGRIASVSDYSGNICFELENGTLLPYHDDLLADINPENRTITLQLPEGLL